MSDVSIPIITSADELDAARGVSLARYVGGAFAVTFTFIALVILISEYLRHSFSRLPVDVFLLVVVFSIICEVYGFLLANRQQGDWAARLVIAGFLVMITASQMTWVVFHGVDAIVLASFGATVVPIGLGSVLSGNSLMFITTGIANVVAATILLILPHWFDAHLTQQEAWISFGIIISVAWVIAILVYGSSTLYVQALEEMGALQIAYQRALQLDSLKDQFITHVNHELRTPIMTAQGTMEFLYAARHTLSPEAEESLFLQANRNMERLVLLLSGILNVQQIEQKGIQNAPEAFPLDVIATAACEMIDPLRQRQIRITLPKEAMVWGNQTSVQQILTNYLANAVKYTPADRPIELTAQILLPRTRSRQNASDNLGQIEIAVTDHGLGIPSDQIPLLFHRFVRLERDLATNIPGSGLGLYLCKMLAEAMGGQVGAESPGRNGSDGTTFWVRLPIPPAGSQPVTRPHQRRIGQESI